MERIPIISEIADVIDSRKDADPHTSYVAKLFSKRARCCIKESRRRGNRSCQRPERITTLTILSTKLPIFGFIRWWHYHRPV